MKGKNILFVLLLSYVLLWFVVLFGLWGIYPLGAYWKTEELKFIQSNKETIFNNEINNLKTNTDKVNNEFTFLQKQVNSLIDSQIILKDMQKQINALQDNQTLMLEWELNHHQFE